MPAPDTLDAWIAGTGHLAPITELLGITPVVLLRGDVTVAMEADARFHSPLGLVHGGVLVDLADVAMGTAVAMTLGPADAFVTTDLHVSFLKSVRDGRVTARAVIVKEGRSTVYLETDVRQGDALLARVMSTCMVRRG